ncbi:MAG: sigma-54-dependent Fis family transcriptional regulator [Pirellulales bacterium]|nr:sigma-54-dependent Fis family transcriptional regulator [Pirellulales bacterium]
MSRRILIVAGDAALAPNCARMLESEGCDIVCREYSAAAVQDALAGDFEAIVIGETTCGPDALDFLRRIRDAALPARTIVLSAAPNVEFAVAAMKEGASDYLREPCSAEELRSALRRIESPSPAASAANEAEPIAGCHAFEGMLGKCAAMREVFAMIERIAPTESTVLVTGESGTGKEMVVRAIHRHSRRREYPLLACDCTALAPTLLESELFGHVKGSFSGAIATKQGLIEVAHQGTLFLDEVANLSQETQGKLLRVLESRRVRKVGDTAEHAVDIRLIVTTNRSLAEMVKAGAFRADLYYRLNVVPIVLPPLRERPGDIPLLAACFLRQFSRQMEVKAKGFSREAMHRMEVYAWPGNVRELRNIVERLSVLYGGMRIEREHLPWDVRDAAPCLSPAEIPRTWEEFKRLKCQVVEDLERRFLSAAMNRCAHNVTQAAEYVGMQRPNFHALLRSRGLKPEK